jgi:hypothetical protein
MRDETRATETRGAVMATTTEHLNGHQRDTLSHIFGHPLSHNIEWHDVLSLLNAIGAVQETSKGNIVVTVGDETESYEPARHKDVDADQVASLRRLLRQTGYAPEGG